MRLAEIVVRRPGFEGLPDMRFVGRNHKVETFSTSTADQALAKCIRLGRLVRSPQYAQAQRLQGLIEFLGINTVAVMDDEAISFIATDAFSKLLQEC